LVTVAALLKNFKKVWGFSSIKQRLRFGLFFIEAAFVPFDLKDFVS
jgi:hypothetical protein